MPVILVKAIDFQIMNRYYSWKLQFLHVNASNLCKITVKVQIHGAILCTMAELHCVSTPKFVVRNIAAVESCPTSATLHATNFFVYPPSATFRAIV